MKNKAIAQAAWLAACAFAGLAVAAPQVEVFTPRGEAKGVRQVAVRFSEPMVAFGDLRLRRVTAGCFAANIASWRVMEKTGMRREQHGVRDSWHAELGWVDGYTYAVLADEHH